MYLVARNNDIFRWFETVRGKPVPKFITGLRGTGKTAFLLSLRDQLIGEGMSPERMLLIDTDDPALRKYTTHEQMLDYILGALPHKGKSYIFIREAAALPNPEVVIGTLAASGQHELFATSSSRRLLNQGLAGYFSTRLAHFEKLPEETDRPYSPTEARAKWNDIFLNDVLAPNRILEVSIAGRVAGWVSDNIGEPTSLRNVATAISPTRQMLSPHTIAAYLTALEDAHLLEKAIRWDTAEESPQKTGYRYFFTDPQLRLAHFGPAPENEARRMALNCAWLHLRHESDRVFSASGSSEIDFVTRMGHTYKRWCVNDDGALVCKG